jgi:hypothetical protein
MARCSLELAYVDKPRVQSYITRVALLFGPGRGWSGFTATITVCSAPFKLASEGESPSPVQQGAFLPQAPRLRESAYDVFFSCDNSVVRIREY